MNRKKLRQIDVANAFLYAPVDAEIFVELPHGSNAGPNQVCQLEKSLYGIKQASRLWQQHLHARLIRIGFLQLPHDQGKYRPTKGTDYILLIVYVDDLLYIGSTDAITTWFEGELHQDLTLTVATTVTQYLGLNIQDGDNAIYLSAEKFMDTIAKRFGLTPTVISTPYRYTDGNRKDSALLKPAGIRDYQRKLGCILFAAVICRPGLSYSASQLATYLKKPEAEHMLELDRALHYLVSTPTIGLTYQKTGTTIPKLIGVASEGAAHSMPGMERNRAAPSPREPREACQHVEFAATSGEYAATAPMLLKPQRPPCFDPSQRGGPTVQSWVFTMNVFFDPNYIESDAAKIRYAVSLLRGPAMDWWRVIGAESGGAQPQGAASSGGSAGASPSLSPQQLREWFVRRTRLRSGATSTGGAGPAGAGGTGVAAGACVTGGAATTGPGGARTRGTGAAGSGGVEGAGAGDLTESCATGAGGARAGGAGDGGPGAGGAGVGGRGVGGAGAGGAGAVDPGGTVRPRPYFVPLLQQVLAGFSTAPSPYTEPFGGLTERREPASRHVSLVRTARRVPHSCPPPVHGTHAMTLRPSSIPLRVPLPAPLESSLHELLDFAAACRLDYATALVAESASASPSSVGGECALGTDDLEDRQQDFESLAAAVSRFASMLLAPEGDPDALDISTSRSYAEAITGPYSSQWQAAMDAKMASWKSTGTYVDEVPPPGANIDDGMCIFRVKWPPGSPPAFKAR
ncbi:unnamed protein product [Closterium sp. NIES-54]